VDSSEIRHILRKILVVFAAVAFFTWFKRRRRSELEPRITLFVRERGEVSLDEIREHLGLGALDAGDVRMVLSAMQRNGSVLVVAATDVAQPGSVKYRLP